MSRAIKYINSNTNSSSERSGPSGSNSSSERSGPSGTNSSSKTSGTSGSNSFPYENFGYNSNNSDVQAALQASLFESRPGPRDASNSENEESNSKSTASKSTASKSSNNNDEEPTEVSNNEYFMTEDVDYVRINVKGDGSCLYRSIYVAAFMYPIDREIVKGLLLPEFEEVDSILGLVLKAFGFTSEQLLDEEHAVTFMRKKLSEGILGTHPDPTINNICNNSITTFYTMVVGHLCEAYNSDISKSRSHLFIKSKDYIYFDGPTAYQLLVGDFNSQMMKFFTDTPVSQLTLHAFKETVAKTILSKTTYASHLDYEIIQQILARKDIILKATSLNRLNPDQKFPIIQNGKPILLVDNINEIHYNALVPKVEYLDYYNTTVRGSRTLANEVSREPNIEITTMNRRGRPTTKTKSGAPIIFSKRTFNYRKLKGLKGGKKTLKSRRRK